MNISVKKQSNKMINIRVFLILSIILITGCLSKNDNKVPVKGVILEKRELTLTLGASEKLNYNLTQEAGTENNTLEWSSSAPGIVSVSDEGVVTAAGIGQGGGVRFVKEATSASAEITVKTADGKYMDKITVTSTTEALADMLTLPPLKDQFKSYFMIGNIFNPGDVDPDDLIVDEERLVHHYNILTAENNMKPGYLSPSKGSYDFKRADMMVDGALAAGFKVHGHVLLWHSQNAGWMDQIKNESKEAALAAMTKYIRDVVTHYKGRIYSWDVLNEVFPDGVSANSDWTKVMRGKTGSPSNPWYVAIGSDFVYEGFLAARLADPAVILYYNDYNTDNAGKAKMIHDMVRDVNERYRREYPNENRLLIEGIGMQEHHNTGVNVSNIRNTINLFRSLGVRLSVSELDVLAQSWNEFSGAGGDGNYKHDKSTVTNSGIRTQARLYGEYMRLYMENSDIIERVTWWGVLDSDSWRSAGLPLLFDSKGCAKPAYYSVAAQLK